jgi:hypothetical protein
VDSAAIRIGVLAAPAPNLTSSYDEESGAEYWKVYGRRIAKLQILAKLIRGAVLETRLNASVLCRFRSMIYFFDIIQRPSLRGIETGFMNHLNTLFGVRLVHKICCSVNVFL